MATGSGVLRRGWTATSLNRSGLLSSSPLLSSSWPPKARNSLAACSFGSRSLPPSRLILLPLPDDDRALLGLATTHQAYAHRSVNAVCAQAGEEVVRVPHRRVLDGHQDIPEEEPSLLGGTVGLDG